MATKKAPTTTLFLIDDAGAIDSKGKLLKRESLFLEGMAYRSLADVKKAYDDGDRDVYGEDFVFEIEIKRVYKVKEASVEFEEVK